MEIDPRIGLPNEAGLFEEIAKGEQKITVTTDKRRYGKVITLVSGFQGIDIKSTAKVLKEKLACGGTIKNGIIELQGNHHKAVRPILVKLGFSEESISD